MPQFQEKPVPDVVYDVPKKAVSINYSKLSGGRLIPEELRGRGEDLGKAVQITCTYLNYEFGKLPEESTKQEIDLTDLEDVEFSTCTITEDVLDCLTNLSCLKRFHMFACSFEESNTLMLPTSLTQLTNLRALELVRCNLQQVPHAVVQMSTLEELAIWGNNKLKVLPENLAGLENLQKLDASDCGLEQCPDVISTLVKLKELRLWGNENITDLPNSMSHLKQLEKLDISSCGFTEFPTVVSRLTTLKELYVLRNHFKSIPSSLAKLKNLHLFCARGCHKLLDYPEVLLRMPSLATVIIYPNLDIDSLPTSPSEIMDVKNLNLSAYSVPDMDVTLCDSEIDLIPHVLNVVPNFVSKLTNLKMLNLSGHRSIKSLPPSLVQLEQLRDLNVSFCGLEDFPQVVCRIPTLMVLRMDGNPLTTLTEPFVKSWHETSFPLRAFVSKHDIDLETLQKPPYEIFKNGSRACVDFYGSIRTSSVVDCSLFGVQILGKTEAGKSSLIHTLNERAPCLVGLADRTVVADTIQMTDMETILQVTDFGGHSIYELTCPLFLKTRNQVTLIAVKLCEYSLDTHDELVTKWLSTALSCVDIRHIAIVATQVDLCDDDEIETKIELLRDNVSSWLETEKQFKTKILSEESPGQQLPETPEVQYFLTSSSTLEGVGKLRNFLFSEARSNKVSIPKHWGKAYDKLLNVNAKEKKFLTLEETKAIFKSCMDPLSRLINRTMKDDFERWLDFLHNTGLLLWYKNNEILRDLVFHDTTAVVQILQGLFRHNICEYLPYDVTKHGEFVGTKIEFDTELSAFHQTGILSDKLLQCIWQTLGLESDKFQAMRQILTQLELCYTDNEAAKNPDDTDGNQLLLRFPWFVHREDVDGIVEKQWPEVLPHGQLQYSLFYNFFNRVSSTTYERLCVKIQKHLVSGGHYRYDFKDTVFVIQDEVRLLLQRCNNKQNPSVQIHLRCPVSRLKFQDLLLNVHKDMDSLCSELPGIVVDAYFHCPHCILRRSLNPKKRPVKQLSETVSNRLDNVPCDPRIPDGDKIPAAMVFPKLLQSDHCDHMKLVQDFCVSLEETFHSTLPAALLLEIAKQITEPFELCVLGVMLGVNEYTVKSTIRDYPHINDASYQVFLHWRQQRTDQGKDGDEMKNELRHALCSSEVGMNSTVSQFKDYFRSSK